MTGLLVTEENGLSAPAVADGVGGVIAKLAYLFVAVCLVLVLSACGGGGRGGPIPYDVTGFGAPDAPAVAAISEDYKISPLDTLTIEVFKAADLSKDYQVDLTGNIFVPLIGEVRAAGMTPRQLQGSLVQRLGKDLYESPQVSVGVKSSSARNVTVDGAVGAPGMYAVNGPVTLLQVIAMAKGPNETANPRRIAVFRQLEGKRMAAAFDLTAIRRGGAEDPPIYAGDIIVVDGSSLKAAQKELLQALPLLSIFRPF
jgi:polysaccharide export outer membrane protein